MSGGRKTLLDNQRWFPVFADAGEDIPPFSVVEISGGTRTSEEDGYRTYLTAAKPTGSATALLAVTGPLTIKDQSFGSATMSYPAWVAFESGSPSAGTLLGAKSGQWTATTSKKNFTSTGLIVTDSPQRVLVDLVTPNQHQGGGSGSGSSAGCCGDCIPQSHLSVLGSLYAGKYDVTGLPSSLAPTGGAVMHYIGLASGLSGVTDGDPYWESDTFDYICKDSNGDDVTSTYFWRFVAGISGSCHAGGGWDNAILYLVNAGSSDSCGLATWRCAPASGATPVVQFTNLEDFRARCGTTLYIHYPQFQNRELENLLPCSVCIAPERLAPVDVTGTCWEDPWVKCNAPLKDVTQFPPIITMRISGISANTDGFGNAKIVSMPETEFNLEYGGNSTNMQTRPWDGLSANMAYTYFSFSIPITWHFRVGSTHYNLTRLSVSFECYADSMTCTAPWINNRVLIVADDESGNVFTITRSGYVDGTGYVGSPECHLITPDCSVVSGDPIEIACGLQAAVLSGASSGGSIYGSMTVTFTEET